MVAWPVEELCPISVDDPLFNWLWLWAWGFLVVNIRYNELNNRIHVKTNTKNRKIPKHKKNQCKTRLLTSQQRPVAFRARFCQIQRLCKARVRHRRIANRLAGERRLTRSRGHSRPVEQCALFRPVSCVDERYEQWLQANCDNLAGGAGGAATTRRRRKQKADGHAKVASLVQLFKQFVNQSGGANFELLASVLGQFQQAHPKKKRKKKVPRAQPPHTAKASPSQVRASETQTARSQKTAQGRRGCAVLLIKLGLLFC